MSGGLADQAVRERLRQELDRSFFVQAGTGTGKTTALVSRIVAMVAAGRLRMEGLVAITFTEAAAAELRDRVRQELERAARATDTTDAERERCRAAAAEVDLAAIQTIHAFAGTLLRTFPLEAGLPPGFGMLDAVQQRLAFEERFRTWLGEEVVSPGDARGAALRRVLLLGLTPDRMRELAEALQERADLLTPDTTWDEPEPPDPVMLARRWGAELVALANLLQYEQPPGDEPHKLADELRRIQFAAQRLEAANDEDAALAAMQRFVEHKPKQVGNQGEFVAGPSGNPAREIKQAFKDSVAELSGVLDAHRSAALADLLGHLRDFTLAYAAERKRQGVATFQDLLVWARDLLRDNPEVRRLAHARFERLFVDEFQDTDPLQAEIAWLLASDPAQALERDWRQLTLVPGRLFLVGDPKQSIYRFRRADLGLYEDIYERLSDPQGRVSLVQNFRSGAVVLDWVNAHFQRDMLHAPGVQASYEALVPRPPGDEPPATVYRIGVALDGGAAARWAAEADLAARLARTVVDEGWRVSRRGEPVTHPARYRDVCILLPSRTNLRRLERAFEQHGVPYRMESGSLVLQTADVRELLACLRAIDDPSDQVALVAALRSPAYGCSDVDLLRWVEAGGRLDYEHPGAGCPGPVMDAVRSLRALNAQRQDRSAAYIAELLIRERLLAAAAFGQPRPREAWRRLRYVVGQARTLAAGGQSTLRALLDWLEGLQRTTFYDPESPVPEADDDAVRLLTVHGAKGLEFPVVILTGLGAEPPNLRDPLLLADPTSGRFDVKCGDFKTRGFREGGDAQERAKAHEQAERVRLLYVAATRAREHLVLSLVRAAKPNQSDAHRIFAVLDRIAAEDGAAELCRDLEVGWPAAVAPLLTPAGEKFTPAEQAADERNWLATRMAAIERLRSERVVRLERLAARATSPPCGLDATVGVDEDDTDLQGPWLDDEADQPPPAPTPPTSTHFARAVRDAFEAADPEVLTDVEVQAACAAQADGLSNGQVGAVGRAVRAALDSAAVRRALAAPRHWRAVPVGIELGGALLEGVADLIYEREGGTLGLVVLEPEPRAAADLPVSLPHFKLRAAACALALERATGRTVGSVDLVFAGLGGQTESVDRDALREIMQAAREVSAATA